MPSRGLAARQAVTSTTVSPERTMTEPSACLASLPVSNLIESWPTETSRVVIDRTSLGKTDSEKVRPRDRYLRMFSRLMRSA